MSKTNLHPYANVDFNSWALRIRMMREAIGLSRPKFAELIDVPPTTLKNYELGYREVSWEFVNKVLWNPRTRTIARELFINLPLAVVDAKSQQGGELRYMVPQLTGDSLWSPHYMMDHMYSKMVQALVEEGLGAHSIETDHYNRWVERCK